MPYLGGLAFEVGEEAELDTFLPCAENQQVLDLLLRFGVEKYRQSALPPHVLAERSIQKTLEQVAIQPREIDAFVYATSTFDEGQFSQRSILELLERFSLRAYPYGIFLSECTHALVAFQLASALLESGSAANVLIATADSFAGKDRRIEPELGIGSDGAASCVVSNRPSELHLDGILLDMDLSMKEWGMRVPSESETQARAERIQALCAQTYQKHCLSASEVCALVTNNFHLGVIRSLCALAGHADGRKAFTGMIGQVGHVYASDMIINLASLLAGKPMPVGAKIMLLATGSYTFASAIVTTTRAPESGDDA